MNYPDLDQPIAEEAIILDQPTDEAAVREHLGDEERAQMGEMAHYLQPARWWLASSAIPLLAVRSIVPSSGSGDVLINLCDMTDVHIIGIVRADGQRF